MGVLGRSTPLPGPCRPSISPPGGGFRWLSGFGSWLGPRFLLLGTPSVSRLGSTGLGPGRGPTPCLGWLCPPGSGVGLCLTGGPLAGSPVTPGMWGTSSLSRMGIRVLAVGGGVRRPSPVGRILCGGRGRRGGLGRMPARLPPLLMLGIPLLCRRFSGVGGLLGSPLSLPPPFVILTLPSWGVGSRRLGTCCSRLCGPRLPRTLGCPTSATCGLSPRSLLLRRGCMARPPWHIL